MAKWLRDHKQKEIYVFTPDAKRWEANQGLTELLEQNYKKDKFRSVYINS